MLWIYLFPGVMDFSLAVLTLFVAVKATWLGAGPVLVGVLGATWGITYFLTSLLLSRFAHRRNAFPLMSGSACLYILLAGGMLAVRSLPFLFALTFACGLATSFFFVGFQIMMGEITGLPVNRTVGFYTLVWSTGLAFGFLAEGALVERGPLASVLPILAAAVMILIGLGIVHRIRPVHPTAPSPESPEGLSPAHPLGRVFVRIGWTSIFTASFLAGGFRFLLPEITVSRYHFSPAVSGFVLFVFLLLQGATGMALSCLPAWRHRLTPGALLKLMGAAGCAAGLLLPGTAGLALFAAGLGIYSGHAFFDGVFYSLADRDRSARNIGVNEALVGIGGVVGPLVFGAAVARGPALFFILPVLALAAGLLVQAGFYRFFPRGTISPGGYQ